MLILIDQIVYCLKGETYSHFGLFALHMIRLLAMAHVKNFGFLQVSQFIAVVSLVNNIVGHLESSEL